MICGWRSDLTIIWALKAVAVVQCECGNYSHSIDDVQVSPAGGTGLSQSSTTREVNFAFCRKKRC